jgi:hypothetical protein
MKIQTTYPYHHADGSLAYEVVRFIPKNFRPRMPDGTYGLACGRILYRLPDILTRKADNFVWVCEGEKDADTLSSYGLVATTAGAAKAWAATDTTPLHGAWGIVVLPDCDDAGAYFADAVARDLVGHTRTIQIINLGGADGYDVTDYLNEHSIDDLMTLRSVTPPWKAPKPDRKRGPRRMARRVLQRTLAPGLPYPIDDLSWELGGPNLHQRGNNRVVYCPAHDDEGGTPGLSLTAIDNDRTMAYCHSGCDFASIARAVRERME